MQRDIFWHEFFWLWGIAAATTALSIALEPLPPAGLSRLLFIPVPTQSEALILLALIVQNSIRLAIIAGVGLVVAHQIGLAAPLLEAWLRREPIRPRLRAAIVPIALTIAVLVAASTLARASLFRPKRTQNSAATNEFVNSPAAEEAFAQMEKLGLVGGKPITRVSLGILSLANAIGGELEGRLFEVSVMVLLLIQLCGDKRTIADPALVWGAVLIVALVHTAENVVVVRENTMLVLNIFRNYGLSRELEPISSALAQTGLRVIPSTVALGLLYVYCGIESAIVAHFCAAVVSPFLTTFWLTHFI